VQIYDPFLNHAILLAVFWPNFIVGNKQILYELFYKTGFVLSVQIYVSFFRYIKIFLKFFLLFFCGLNFSALAIENLFELARINEGSEF